MIASVRGEVRHVGLDAVVVDVGGVGLTVHTTPGTAATLRVGGTADLATTLIVREESLTLYGFLDQPTRSVFETLQSVSGVGPKLALAMLAVYPAEAIGAAIRSSDFAALMRIPGIGRKSAERLVLELRDKFPGPTPTGGVPGTPSALGAAGAAWQRQVRDALVGLGWSAKQADDAIAAVTPQASAETPVSAMLRAALQMLGKT